MDPCVRIKLAHGFSFICGYLGHFILGWFCYLIHQTLSKGRKDAVATIITFLAWGFWHYMYFYMTNSLQYIQHVPFLVGLLGSSFILGVLYKISGSLWLCVLFHCLLNVFAQTLLVNNLIAVLVCNMLCIALATALARIKGRSPVETQ